jgi:hypothetical protein
MNGNFNDEQSLFNGGVDEGVWESMGVPIIVAQSSDTSTHSYRYDASHSSSGDMGNNIRSSPWTGSPADIKSLITNSPPLQRPHSRIRR